MRLDVFRGQDFGRVLTEVRSALGDEALILRSRAVSAEGGRECQIVATTPTEVERFRQRLGRSVPPRPDRGRRRQRIIALVGPTGVGKTTSIAKLALSPRGFGGSRVGLLTLDTYRVAAVDQLQTYAEIANLPFEVVYDRAEIAAAMTRLRHCDVVLVDTPGRSPRDPGEEWRALLRALRPDEVHLVMPAGVRADVALAARDGFASCGTTHLLLTKLDEVPGEDGTAELADAFELPTRWVCDGQDVPSDLGSAVPRLVAALGGAS